MMKFGPSLLVCLIASLTQLAGQTISLDYRSDNSDWWSLLRTDDANENIPVQERAPASSSFKILDIDLGDDTFSKAATELGKASVIDRGDASAGRSQICYSSEHHDPRIHLIFESGEVSRAFYLFQDGPDWSGNALCVRSNLVTLTLSAASGLHLGQTSAEVKAILGKPSALLRNKIIYSYSVQIKTPPRRVRETAEAAP